MILKGKNTTLALIIASSMVLSACSDSGSNSGDVQLNFAAKVNNQDFTCGGTYSGVGSGLHDFKVTDYRMYIYDVRIHDVNGNEIELALEQDGTWQLDDVAMLDFENSDDSADCNGTPEMNTAVVGSIDGILEGDVSIDLANTEVCFVVGVPFEKNHLNESTAVSPLNASGMLWAWKIGRKYVRIDGVGDPAAAANNFNIHLGAQGNCGTGTRDEAATQECTVPNTVEVCLDNFDISRDVIAVDVAGVLEATDIAVSASPMTPPGCQSFTGDDDCEEVMPRLGLDYTYGRSASGVASTYNAGQNMFSKQ